MRILRNVVVMLSLAFLSACNREKFATVKVNETAFPTIDPSWSDCLDLPESTSINGQWVALLCYYPANSTGGLYTKIYNDKSHLTWLFDVRTIFPFAESLSSLRPVHWSRDGKYLYLTSTFCCADVTWEFSSHGLALHRLDLETGHLFEVLSLPSEETLPVEQLNQISYAFAFSPDDGSLIYSSPIERSKFHLKSLLSNKDKIIDVKVDYKALGNYEWSPDGTKVTFIGMTENYVKNGLSLLLMNIGKDKVTVILDHDTRLLVPSQWIDQNNISLFSMYLDQPKYNLNILTGEMTITATPVPTP